MISINKIINFENNDIYKYSHEVLIFKIKNILNVEFAKVLYKTIFHLKDKYWYSAVGFDNLKNESKILKKNKKRIDFFKKKAKNNFKKDKFSYIFEKTMIYTKYEISELEKTLRLILGSNLFISYLNKITNNKLNLTKLNTMFVSRYKSGHYLAPHSDINNGKLAFVINLSYNWKPQYGGILHILNNDRTEILHSFVPSFNNMVIFEIPEEGIPHYVSNVSPNIKNIRYALTGWYS